MASGGGGFGSPPPPAKPAAGTTGAQGDGTAPPLHGSAGASAAAQADGAAPPLHGSATASAAAQANGTAPPLHGGANAGAAATGYVGVGAIRPQMRGAAGAGTRATSEVNINAGAMPVQSDRPVTLAAHGNAGAGTRMEVRMSTQPEQGVRISSVAHAPANPPGRHDPSRVASQIQTGAGSSSSVAQVLHMQGFLVPSTVIGAIENLARNRTWNVLEEFLRQIIRTSGSTIDNHPRLLLYCRRGWLIHLLQARLGRLAIRFHQGYIAPLRHMPSQFADNDEMRSQLDAIWGSITRDPSYTELLASHPDNIVDIIMDYMRLHFPEAVGHTNPRGTQNLLWAFAVHLGRESRKVRLRCILCQQLMTSDRVGQDMSRHLQENCPKMTPHWRAKMETLSHEPSSKKRPRSATSKQAGPTRVAFPSWKMLITSEFDTEQAQEAIGTLARLGLNNKDAMYHAIILHGELEYIAQLGDDPFFLSGRLDVAVNALQDLAAAFMLEGEEASPALKELTVRLYKLQFLIPYCLAYVQPNAPTQMVQNQDETLSDSQQHVAVPSTQQQQVVAAPAGQEVQVVAAPLVEDQAYDVDGQNIGEEHVDQGDDPLNILMEQTELDVALQHINQLLDEP